MKFLVAICKILLPTVTNQMYIILSIGSKNSTEQNRTAVWGRSTGSKRWKRITVHEIWSKCVKKWIPRCIVYSELLGIRVLIITRWLISQVVSRKCCNIFCGSLLLSLLMREIKEVVYYKQWWISRTRREATPMIIDISYTNHVWGLSVQET